MSADLAKVDITKIKLTEVVTFKVENFSVPSYAGGFNRDEFFKVFMSKHVVGTFHDLIVLLVDLTRYNFTPKTENLPGFDMEYTYKDDTGADQTVKHSFESGKTKVHTFDRNKGAKYCYTNACLATAGLFQDIFAKSSDAASIFNSLPGFVGSMNQYHSSLAGVSVKDIKACHDHFKNWATSVGLKPRDDGIQKMVEAAAEKTIDDIKANPAKAAFSFIQAVQFCTGTQVEPTMGVSK